MAHFDETTEYMLSQIPKYIWDAMPAIVQTAWEKEAMYFKGTPIDFAIQFITMIRTTPSEYKTELLKLLALKNPDNPRGKIAHLGKKEPVRIAKLIKRYPEKETGYDKKLGKEYWSFEWSDGTKGEDSLYQSQIESVLKRKSYSNLKIKEMTRAQIIDTEPWLMTKEQYKEALDELRYIGDDWGKAGDDFRWATWRLPEEALRRSAKSLDYWINLHKEQIRQALSEGKPVPREVLKDYPDLVKKHLR